MTLLQATVPAAMASDGVDVDGLAGVCFTRVRSLGYASLPAHSPSFPQLLLAPPCTYISLCPSPCWPCLCVARLDVCMLYDACVQLPMSTSVSV